MLFDAITISLKIIIDRKIDLPDETNTALPLSRAYAVNCE